MGTIASSATSVTKLAHFRLHFPVWLSFFSLKTLSKIAISAPQNTHFQPFLRVHKPTKIRNTFIHSNLQIFQNSLIYGKRSQKRKIPLLARAFVKTIQNCLLNKDTCHILLIAATGRLASHGRTAHSSRTSELIVADEGDC